MQSQRRKPTEDLFGLALDDVNAELEAARKAHAKLLESSFLELMQQRAAIEALEQKAERIRLEQEEHILRLASGAVSLTEVKASKPIPRGKGGRPPTSNHPFPVRVGNVRQWCADHDIPWSVAKSWYSRGKVVRPIPRKWAELLQRTHGISLNSWRGGISDHPQAGVKKSA